MSNNNHRFKLSHLMPNSWFYKLRDMKRPRPPSQRSSSEILTSRSSKRPSHYYSHGTTTPKPLPLSPHQFYPYPKIKETMPLAKLRPSVLHLNPKETDIQFAQDHHHHHLHGYHHQSSISRASANIVEPGDTDDFQELQLRPIRTRPSSAHGAISSCSCPSSPKLRSRRLLLHVTSDRGRVNVSTTTSANNNGSCRRRSVARRSFAIVKASTDPRRDFRESMVEMITENRVHAEEDLQELLECYLSLNSREHHEVIMEVFRAISLEVDDDEDSAFED